MQARVRSWHETLNGRLKNWCILAQVYCHNIIAHGTVFHACVVVTQLSIANGEPLFKVEYGHQLNYIVTTPCNTSNTLFPTITYVTPKTIRGQLVGQPPKIPQPHHARVQKKYDDVYRLVWATKVALVAICLVLPALVLGYKSFNVSMYHVPVPLPRLSRYL